MGHHTLAELNKQIHCLIGIEESLVTFNSTEQKTAKKIKITSQSGRKPQFLGPRNRRQFAKD